MWPPRRQREHLSPATRRASQPSRSRRGDARLRRPGRSGRSRRRARSAPASSRAARSGAPWLRGRPHPRALRPRAPRSRHTSEPGCVARRSARPATAAVRALPFPRDLFACRNAVQPDLKHTLMSSTGSSVSRTTASTWASAAGTPTPSSGTPASPQAAACAATARRYSTPASPAAPATLPRPARGAAVPSLPTQGVPRSTYLPQAAPECDSPRLDANLSLQSSTVTLLDQENRQGLWVACPDCHAATALAACCGHGPKVCPPELVRVLPWSGHPPRQRPRRGGNRGDVGQVRGSGAPEFPNRAVIAARPEQRWSRRRFCCPPGPPAARFRAGAGPAKAVLSFDG